MNFWDRLYFGLGAEYLITGELFMAGYEAFKLPADFGLDLIVTKQKKTSFRKDAEEAGVGQSFVLQVKSRQIEKFTANVMGRLEASTSISLKEEEWNLITKDENSYLVSVLIFNEDRNKLQNRWTYFWLHSSHLLALQDKGYVKVIEDKDTERPRYFLKIYLRLQSYISLGDLLDELVEDGELTEDGRDILLENLAPSVPTKWNTREYISLARPDKTHTGGGRDVVRKIPDELTSFTHLGENVPLKQLN